MMNPAHCIFYPQYYDKSVFKMLLALALHPQPSSSISPLSSFATADIDWGT